MSMLDGKKILVVDDDEMLRDAVADVFKFNGAEVTEAENGEIAFSLVQRNQYDVVFSDVRMPGGDGITLAKNISELPGDKPLMFIYSGFNDLTKEKAAELNILKVFEKPFEQKLMLKEICARLAEVKKTR